MSNLHTSYLGLDLKNPLIASSSSLSSSIEGIKKLADSGVGAIVLKSLFEEQIAADTDSITDDYNHSEAYDYLQQTGMSHGAQDYIDLISAAKKEIDIPVIASINCVSAQWWKQYASNLESSGADALELNLSLMPQRFSQPSVDLENELAETVQAICSTVKLPVSVKIGPYFTSLPQFSLKLKQAGADSLTLFNRFYQYDLDLLSGKPKGRLSLSDDRDYNLSLRWIAILFERCGMQLSASTGVHSGETALKLIASGADTVQLCSVYYKSNMQATSRILDEMKQLMEKMGVQELSELRGKYSQSETDNPESIERLQYIKALTGIS